MHAYSMLCGILKSGSFKMTRVYADSQRVFIQQGFVLPQKKLDRTRSNFCPARSFDERTPEKQILDRLNSTEQTIRSIVEEYKLATKLPAQLITLAGRLIPLADRLVNIKGKTLGNDHALYDLAELVCYALSGGVSAFSSDSKYDGTKLNNLDFGLRSGIATAKKTIDAFLRLKGKWGIVTDDDKHRVRYEWKSGIRHAESMLSKEPSIFAPLVNFFSDLFTPTPIKITVGSSGTLSGSSAAKWSARPHVAQYHTNTFQSGSAPYQTFS
jgi:hypothetical protein